MHPLIVPAVLLFAALSQRNQASGPHPAQNKPQRRSKPRGRVRIGPVQVIKAKRPTPPPITITHVPDTHPDVIPTPPDAQAAVDAAMQQVVRELNPTIVQPPPDPNAERKAAAQRLLDFLIRTGRFGTLAHASGPKDRPQEVKEAQRALGVVPDGIVGPKTRAAAAAVGVAIPPRPRS